MYNNYIIYGASIAIGSSLLQLFFPWWIVVFPCFLLGLLKQKKNNFFPIFSTGFISIGLLWGVYAAMIQIYTGSELSHRVAEMFQLPSNDFIGIISAMIGGFTGGLSALCGALIKWASVDLKPVEKSSTPSE
ncbi:hypothetical protein [Flammeovirga aprica]|uniref:DUF4199 domain-containing protein n=1 Tax=Flammeovirga aprica JL-4 TaxID=694437 RepID=A0A7X9XCF8_9BACT|nr:hypothetical protein [Flammeovirga aprica]NME71771.1 hypothetical protein [Flammeovirga aprica JL-4]